MMPETLHLCQSWNAAPQYTEGGIWSSGQGGTVDAIETSTIKPEMRCSMRMLEDSITWRSIVKLSPTGASWRRGRTWRSSIISPGRTVLPRQLRPRFSLGRILHHPGIIPSLRRRKRGQDLLCEHPHPTKYNPTDLVYNTITVTGAELFDTPIYYRTSTKESMWMWPKYSQLHEFPLITNDTYCVTLSGFIVTGAQVNHPGGYLTFTADRENADSGILWASVPQTDANHDTVKGNLFAYVAPGLQQLWTSASRVTDQPNSYGCHAKFNHPTVTMGGSTFRYSPVTRRPTTPGTSSCTATSR